MHALSHRTAAALHNIADYTVQTEQYSPAMVDTAPAAKRARLDYNTNTLERGQPVLLPPQLVEIQLAKKSSEGEHPNHVLLFTVLNPTYPITCDVLHTIASPFGSLLRIVIFKKNGVQAMVEYDGQESAQRAKETLHGCDIYSGCCTLKIEYAKPTKLNVYKNDTESFDYTNPGLGKGLAAVESTCTALAPHRPVLLKEPLLPAEASHHLAPLTVAIRPGLQYAAGPGPQLCSAVSLLSPGLPRLPSQPAQSACPPPTTVMPGPAPAPHQQPQGSVTMVYGLNCHKMSCTKIFNVFCLYGNVVRVKFLKTKEGCAMVQLGDSLAVERVVTNLNNITFFESKMQLGFSKQAFLADVQQPYELHDGSPSFMDFMGNKNNRFINPEMASKNRIQPPSKILHFFNTPPGLDASNIEDIFLSQNTPRPKCIKMFPSKTDRSSSGLIEFESLSEALESLVMANHVPVENPNGKFPYIMKLCFSSSKAIPAVIH